MIKILFSVFIHNSKGADFLMAIVRVRENESGEYLIRRFKRSVEKDGLVMEMRRREFFEKPTWERKRKKAAAVKRYAKKLLREAAKPRDRADAIRANGGSQSESA